MDDILDYSSSSPAASPSSSALASSIETVSLGTENRRIAVAQRLADQRRLFAHRSTREESAFDFRSYSVKRRRRREPNASQIVDSGALEDILNDSPLIRSDEEVPGVSTAASKQMKSISLRKQTRLQFVGHNNIVNELQWHPRQADLFLSASMDVTVRVWTTVASSSEKCRRVLTHHSLGVKSAKWSIDGNQILTGGFDGVAYCIDAETGQVRQKLRWPDASIPAARIERITTVCCHPTDPNSVLLGTDQGHIYGHDLREKAAYPTASTTYAKSFADVHDLLVIEGGQRFVSSAGVMQRDASNQTLLVWDWRSATLLYDRLDNNMLAHSCLRAHPSRPYFVAQCSGNYATLYSSHAPYKWLKGSSIGGHRPPIRYEGGHEVNGYRIQCSFSCNGELWASGDANGRVVIYRTTGKRQVVDSFQVYGRRTACISAEFRPVCTNSMDSTHALLTSSSAGGIDLFQ